MSLNFSITPRSFAFYAALLAASPSLALAAACPSLGEPMYSAILKADAKTAPTQSAQTRSVVGKRGSAGKKGGAYRIVIAAEKNRVNPGADRHGWVAQIQPIAAAPGECVAVCELKHWDRTPGDTQYVDMDCRTAHGLPLTSAATLLWARAEGPATLRFGTWLGGYKPYPLLVEIDRYSLPAGTPGVRLSRLEER